MVVVSGVWSRIERYYMAKQQVEVESLGELVKSLSRAKQLTRELEAHIAIAVASEPVGATYSVDGVPYEVMERRLTKGGEKTKVFRPSMTPRQLALARGETPPAKHRRNRG